ncbi:hypothetical protein A4X13_0g6377 [Tilletia indica]|uniref:Integrase catalytic domain-containing protein n=1 Tax=Tilletia indica TaxID=43049 RepID=A0A177T5Y3_9BASI|nr:hypothetical protein A4X13_0g6377 [Tilletia indica]
MGEHCPPYLATKLQRKTGRLDIEDDASLPFEAISIDLLLGFPRSRAGNDAVVAVHDLFSRMILMEPCSATVTVEGIAAVISNRVLRLGWRPRRIIPDSEARLTGEVMTGLAASLGAELTPSVPHHHQANPVERAIQTAKHVLQTLCVESKSHWDKRAVPAAELAMNSTPSVSTGMSPYDLVFIAHPDLVHAVFDSGEHAGVGAFDERLAAADARLDDAKAAILVARREQQRKYDGSRAPLPVFEVGDSVFVRLPDRPVPGAPTHKLAARKMGPFRIREVLGDHRVRLDLPDHLRIGDTFSNSQLDVAPSGVDPFLTHREVPSSPAAAEGARPSSSSEDSASPPLPPRVRRAPAVLRDYETEPSLLALSPASYETLRGRCGRSRSHSFPD